LPHRLVAFRRLVRYFCAFSFGFAQSSASGPSAGIRHVTIDGINQKRTDDFCEINSILVGNFSETEPSAEYQQSGHDLTTLHRNT
jgi:hypothetical protein